MREVNLKAPIVSVQEDLLEAIGHNLGDALIWVDVERNILGCNETALRMLGYPREELLTINLNDVLPAGLPEEFSVLDAALGRPITGNRTVNNRCEVRMKDGQVFLADAVAINLKDQEDNRTLLAITIKANPGRGVFDGSFAMWAADLAIGIYIVQEGRFRYANPQFQNDIGFGEEELREMNPLSRVHPEDREWVRQNAIEMLKGQRSSGYEFRAVTSDGEIRWAHETVATVEYNGKRATLGNYIDITEHKHAEEALRKSEERLRRGQEFSRMVAWDNFLLNDKIQWSGDVDSLFGRPADEMACGADFFGVIHPDDVVTAREFSLLCMRTGTDQGFEFRVVWPDGTMRWLMAKGNCLRDASGRAINLMGLVMDVTERREAEDRLKESERRYHDLFNSSPDAIAQLTADGRFLAVNAMMAHRFGCAANELVRKTIHELMPRELADARLRVMQQALNQRRTLSFEDRRGNKHFFNTVVPLIDADQEETIEVISRDITEQKWAEDEAREQRDFLRDLIAAAPALIIGFDAKGRIILFNKQAEATTGWKAEEAMGKNWTEHFVPERCREEVTEDFRAICREGKTYFQREQVIVTREGEERVLSCNSNNIKDAAGKVRSMFSIAVDITEQRRAEQAVKRERDFSNGLIQTAAALIVGLDSKGEIILFNKQAEATTGWKAEEAMGKTWLENFVPENRRPQSLEDLKTMIERGGALCHYEQVIVSKDGEERLVSWNSTNIKDSAGAFIAMLSIGIDITDRKRVEEEVRRERDFSTNMINTAAALIVGLNRAGDITIFNKEAEKITKWTREEVLGTNWLDRFVPERYRKQAHLEFERAMKGDILYTQNEVPVITKEGEERVLSCNTTSIKDVTGEVVVGIAIGIDITGRKQAEEELRQKNEELLTMEEDLRELNHRLEDKVRDRTSEIERLLKQKNDFVSQLGHDLRSPLTPLVALLPMLAEREEDAKSKELFNVIIRNVHYMKELVAKTLSLAKLNSAVADFKISNLNLSKALHELLESRRFLFAENNILVENRVSGSITVAADRLRLLELFDNLIANAVRFMHEGGSLIFDAQESGEVVTVGVKDTGIGMTSEQVDRIFDEFYKVDESRQKLDSPGLGLTICKRIVEKHGGTIWAESEGLGKGTAMYFTIPSPRGIACREFDHLIPKATM